MPFNWNSEWEEQSSTPSTPGTNRHKLYPKTDGVWYTVDDAGTETTLAASGGAATTALDNLASVQVNDDIIPDTDSTHDLGSSAARWAEVWADTFVGALEAQVYNNSGGAIAVEQVVYESGFNVGSSLVEVDLADSDAAGKEEGLGITAVAINNASTGRVVTFGVATYPTTGMSVGDRLYISTTAGSLTNTRPTSGKVQEFATVLRVGASTVGQIFVNPHGIVDLDATETLTNKTIDADNNTVSNIGSAEVKAELITGLTADATPDGAADYVMTYDNSATALKKVLLNNLPGGGGSSLTVEEEDGTPSVSSVSTLKFTNGTVTDNGSGSVSVNISGGGSLPVDDTTSIVRDPVDNTKTMRIDVGNVATATTRVLTMPDADVPLYKNNMSASTSPTTTDDSSAGYAVGSMWYDTTNDFIWSCVDATASAAVWRTVAGTAHCYLSRGAAKSIPNGTATAIDFGAGTEVHDTHAFHDTSTNNTRITIPTGLGGIYTITGNTWWAANAANDRWVAIRLNGTTWLGIQSRYAGVAAQHYQQISVTFNLDAADYVELVLQQTSGGAINAVSDTYGGLTFSVTRIGDNL